MKYELMVEIFSSHLSLFHGVDDDVRYVGDCFLRARR